MGPLCDPLCDPLCHPLCDPLCDPPLCEPKPSGQTDFDLWLLLPLTAITPARSSLQESVKKDSVPADVLAKAKAADVVTFGSPSAVKAWVSLVGMPIASAKVRG